jgi:hypothetical protein
VSMSSVLQHVRRHLRKMRVPLGPGFQSNHMFYKINKS